MACLSCSSFSVFMTKAVAFPFASLTDNPSPSPSQEIKTNPKPQTRSRTRRRRQRLNHQQKPQPPSIIRIERAIGAGSFRDADSRHFSFSYLLLVAIVTCFSFSMRKQVNSSSSLYEHDSANNFLHNFFFLMLGFPVFFFSLLSEFMNKLGLRFFHVSMFLSKCVGNSSFIL